MGASFASFSRLLLPSLPPEAWTFRVHLGDPAGRTELTFQQKEKRKQIKHARKKKNKTKNVQFQTVNLEGGEYEMERMKTLKRQLNFQNVSFSILRNKFPIFSINILNLISLYNPR